MLNSPISNNMKYSVLCFFFLLFLGCSSERINQEKYDVIVGERIDIFYGENSCCGRCWNDTELTHLKFVEVKTIEIEKDCAGCTSTYAKSYEAISAGIDTIKTQSYAMSASCRLDSGDIEIFLVSIKKSL